MKFSVTFFFKYTVLHFGKFAVSSKLRDFDEDFVDEVQMPNGNLFILNPLNSGLS